MPLERRIHITSSSQNILIKFSAVQPLQTVYYLIQDAPDVGVKCLNISNPKILFMKLHIN